MVEEQMNDTGDTFTSVFSVKGYGFTVTIHRRKGLNKIGKFYALNHDGHIVRQYLEECVQTGRLAPHDVTLEAGVRFSINNVSKLDE